jgi:proteasome lid subunit RPN8/RPN11
VKILRPVLERIEEHARGSLPAECCGILLARHTEGGQAHGAEPKMVTSVLRAENAEIEHPDRRYVLGHRAHIRAVEMEASGAARIVGYYHSHPEGGIRPSGRDMELAADGVAYLIMSVAGGQVRHAAWRLEGETWAAETLEVSESSDEASAT